MLLQYTELTNDYFSAADEATHYRLTCDCFAGHDGVTDDDENNALCQVQLKISNARDREMP